MALPAFIDPNEARLHHRIRVGNINNRPITGDTVKGGAISCIGEDGSRDLRNRAFYRAGANIDLRRKKAALANSAGLVGAADLARHLG